MNHKRMSLVDDDREFQHYYLQHLEPLERRYESLRRKAVQERNLRIVAALVAWLAAVGGIGYLAHPIGEFWPFVGFFALVNVVGLGVWAWLPAVAHIMRLKDQVLTRIVPFFGDLRYQAEPDLVPGRYGSWKVLPNFSKAKCEDQIEGSYRGVPLKLAEVKFEYKYSSINSDTKSTGIAFKGLMIAFELGQEYSGVTLVRSQGSDMNNRFHLDEVLEEVGVGSGFEVFATSDAPGGTLADAMFLERLAEVSAQFEARHLFASFHADRLVMLIDHKGNYFEMSHRQKTNFAQDAERVRDELGRFFSIVDLLQLRGVSAASGKGTGLLESPAFPELSGPNAATPYDIAFPELPGPNAADPYDIGGWGCLGVFVIFAVAMSAYLWILDTELSKGALLWWSALGGSLTALGLFQAIRGVLSRSMGTVIFGIILLTGAFVVLYYYGSPETQGLIRSWMPGL